MASQPSLIAASALAFLVFSSPARAAGDVTAAAMLHQVSLPADAVTRESTFAYRVVRPERPSGRVLVLMHGSGGDESTLVSLASRIAPDAMLIGVRGRVVQDGVKRWYKKLTATEFDQKDVRVEASAFVDFIARTARDLNVDLSAATFLGYSNGANLIAALTQLHPGLVSRAVLLRPMPVLNDAPQVDLSSSRFLTIAGQNDKLYYPFASHLEERLRGCGANVDARVIASGHNIGEEDIRIAAEWLGRAQR